MSIDQQLERWVIFNSQVQKASAEGTIVVIGDMNLDLDKIEESSYYLKKVAEQHQSMIGELGLHLFHFGITWTRSQKDGTIKRSSIDQAFTNRISTIHSYHKIPISYSDHSAIYVNVKSNMRITNQSHQKTTTRDYRKLRSNPKFFLKKISEIDWISLASMEDVDKMEAFFTAEINKCLDSVAPWTSRLYKQKRHNLPKVVQEKIKLRKELQKKYNINVQNDKVDVELQKQLKSKSTFVIN